jgi:Uma2 family endonuclease
MEMADNKSMPVALENPIPFVAPPHKLWTREECEALTRAGLLQPERYELIAGELILKMGKNYPHMLSLTLLTAWLHSAFGALFVVPEPSIDLHPEDNPTSEPEPDVIVLNRSVRELSARPRPEELWLVAEISSTTLSFDRTVKARLYARAGIVEYWVLDVEGRRLIVHRRPENGRYLDVVAYLEDESVATLGAPEVMTRVGDLL